MSREIVVSMSESRMYRAHLPRSVLGPLGELDLSGIDWLIAGGESGHRHRPPTEAWITDLRDRCVTAGVAFFFKQWGGRTPKIGGRDLDGRTWDEMPALIAG